MRKLLRLVCSLLLVACTPSVPEVNRTGLHDDFMELRSSQQKKKIHEFDLETQYELFLVGQQGTHPPLIFLADEIAKNGKTIIPLLRTKLEATNNELTIRDIVQVLNRMQQLKTYDVRQDKSIMGLAETRAAGMTSVWKPVVEEMIAEIRTDDFG